VLSHRKPSSGASGLKHVNRITLLLAIAAILVCAVLWIKLARDGKSLSEIISAVGSVASVVALIIAIAQIIAVKKTGLATQQAVEQTKNQLLLNISISDLSKAIKLTEQIQTYLGSTKFEIAHLKLQELRILLVHFKGSALFVNQTDLVQYTELLREIGIHIVNLYNAVFRAKLIQIGSVNKTLENVIETLVAVEHKLTLMENKNDPQARTTHRTIGD
jgi:hypothetical protein